MAGDPPARSFELKSIAAYGTGAEAAITAAPADTALAKAERFLAAIETLLNTPAPDGP